MQNPTRLRSLVLVLSGIAAMAMSVSASAQHTSGGAHAGASGGRGAGYHGGYGGYRGGYGWRGGHGWGGWRGGYGFYGPWAWGGFGLGLYLATLPWYYSTIWWDGVPYYYADNAYYRWNGTVNQYEMVTPPSEIQNQSAAPSGELIAYPKNGQSPEQLGKDKFECHRWAAGQTGFDPTQPAGSTATGRRSDYFRAQAACLEGRGYSVK